MAGTETKLRRPNLTYRSKDIPVMAGTETLT